MGSRVGAGVGFGAFVGASVVRMVGAAALCPVTVAAAERVGAAICGAFGASMGAGIGAGIGAGVSIGIGAGVGAGIGAPIARSGTAGGVRQQVWVEIRVEDKRGKQCKLKTFFTSPTNPRQTSPFSTYERSSDGLSNPLPHHPHYK